MQTILHKCCGLDVHKDSVAACIIKSRNPIIVERRREDTEKEIRVFATFSSAITAVYRVLINKGCLSDSDVESETRRISQAKKADLKRAISGKLTLQQCHFLTLPLYDL
jgi:hypothetical protein